jgi:hypothetical protein
MRKLTQRAIRARKLSQHRFKEEIVIKFENESLIARVWKPGFRVAHVAITRVQKFAAMKGSE